VGDQQPAAPITVAALIVAVVFELDLLDDRLLDAQQGAPHPGVAHAVPRS